MWFISDDCHHRVLSNESTFTELLHFISVFSLRATSYYYYYISEGSTVVFVFVVIHYDFLRVIDTVSQTLT